MDGTSSDNGDSSTVARCEPSVYHPAQVGAAHSESTDALRVSGEGCIGGRRIPVARGYRSVAGRGRLEIGHARQRCVLVALLIDGNRPVRTEQLIDRVWADEPPHRARNALAGYVSRLRTVLDAEGLAIRREA